MRVRAVVTAGGRIDGAFARAAGTAVKALVRVGERTMLDTVLDACAGAGIDGVAVVGGDEVAAHLRGGDVRVIPAADDGETNIGHALAAWPGERIVYLTSDLPFANPDGVRDLVARSAPLALAMGLASGDAYAARFPGAPPNGVVLAGERVVNACAFVVDPSAVDPLRAVAAKFFSARKRPLAMARLLGPGLLVRFALRRLEVDGIERHARRRLGLPLGAIRACDPALCYDVDTFDDWNDACARHG